MYNLKPSSPNHVETCFPDLLFPYKQKIHHPNHRGRDVLNNFYFVTYLRKGILEVLLMYTWELTLKTNGVPPLLEEEGI